MISQSGIPPVNFKTFKRKLAFNRKAFRRYINRTEKVVPKGMDKLTPLVDAEVWAETDCLSCGNCCKKMTPTFTEKDLKRIAPHFELTTDEFKKKWLRKERNGDWVNVKQPCQFLDLESNMCSIYAIRPADCAAFPHFLRKPWSSFAYIHKQNIEYCPATYKFIEKLSARIG